MFVSLLALLTGLPAAQVPPPPFPVLPGRPPSLAHGLILQGVLGEDCSDRRDATGRWRHESWTSLASGQTIWLSVASPDFDAVLEVVDAAGATVMRVSDTAGGSETGARFTAPGPRSSNPASLSYTLRLTSAAPGETGRWIVEDRRDGETTRMSRDDGGAVAVGSASSVDAGACVAAKVPS